MIDELVKTCRFFRVFWLLLSWYFFHCYEEITVKVIIGPFANLLSHFYRVQGPFLSLRGLMLRLAVVVGGATATRIGVSMNLMIFVVENHIRRCLQVILLVMYMLVTKFVSYVSWVSRYGLMLFHRDHMCLYF